MGSRHVVEISFYCFDLSWLKETTVRGLLVHVLAQINSKLCLDDAEEIIVNVMQHVDEYDFSRASRKRPYVKIIATSLLDDEVYDVMMDVPMRQFDFIVKIRESVAYREGYLMHFKSYLMHRGTKWSFPRPWYVTVDNIANDILVYCLR